MVQAGEKQYAEFVKKRLLKRKKDLESVILNTCFILFSYLSMKRERKKDKVHVSTLKKECNLFSLLHISCQVREANLDDLLMHKNQNYPP